MARYIDAEKVIEKIVNTPSMLPYEYDFDEKVLSSLAQRQNEILDIVEMNVPTEDVAPVIHARWVLYHDETNMTYGSYACTNCKTIQGLSKYRFCPYCGAKMDEEVE